MDNTTINEFLKAIKSTCNSIKAIDISYLRSSRTIETILLQRGELQKVIFVYNYEGYHFRVFKSIIALILFFEDASEPLAEFDDESDMDNYLKNYNLND